MIVQANQAKKSVLAFATGIIVVVGAGAAVHAAYPWAKQAGSIQGEWRTSCKEAGGMTVQFTMQGSKATGRIANLGRAGKYGYSRGEEILRLSATDLGKWNGQLHWRSISHAERWDPISFVLKGNALDAIQTTDHCYRNMARVK